MTPLAVVDASALAAVIFGEPGGRDIGTRFEGFSLLAPGLLRYEMANVTLVKMRRHPDQRHLLRAAFEHFQRSPIAFAGVDLVEALSIAERRTLTAHDAAYVWLAKSRGAGLLSLDERMNAAFAAETAANGREL